MKVTVGTYLIILMLHIYYTLQTTCVSLLLFISTLCNLLYLLVNSVFITSDKELRTPLAEYRPIDLTIFWTGIAFAIPLGACISLFCDDRDSALAIRERRGGLTVC